MSATSLAAKPAPVATPSGAQRSAEAARAARLAALLHGPLLPTLVRLALPTVAVLFMTTLLSIAETYFVSALGLDAIAAASLVVPVMMLMTMVANGGVGGGVSSAIAHAMGSGRTEDAESLAWHAVVVGVGCGAVFTVAAFLFGPAIYRTMGGSGRTLEQALLYSDILFGGAIMFWIVMLLQSALRGAGNVKTPAAIVLGGVVAGLALSPALISGWFGLPHMGVAGAGVAQVVCNCGSLAAIVLYMRSRRTNLRLRRLPLKRAHFKAILGVGLLSTLNAVMTTLSISAMTAAAGAFGVAAIAGYGIASRLDTLIIPVMFGFGTAAITVVGTSLGAGDLARARRAALVNALFVAALLETLGVVVALWPGLWIGLFTADAEVLRIGGHYLRLLGPCYGIVAITAELYFAGQGARRVGWPLAAGAVRFLFAVAAALAVVGGALGLEEAFVVVALGALAGGATTLFGFWRVKWVPGR